MTTVTRSVTITDPVGLHARPASEFVQKVNESQTSVTIAKQGAASVDASSILSVLSLGIAKGDVVELTVDGENADAVADDLKQLLENQG